MNTTLPKECLQWATQNTLKNNIKSHFFNNAKAKLIRLPLVICIFALALFVSQDVQAQTYTGTISFDATIGGVTATYTYDYSYTITSPTEATVTATYTSAVPDGLVPQLNDVGFVGMSGSNPYTYSSITVTDGDVDFFFWMAYAGGVAGSPTINNANSTLPVTLSNFSASAVGASAAELNWNTTTEINSDFFGIERSTDGVSWDKIGEVQAAGNSNTQLAYSYTDRDIVSNRFDGNIYYYRLKMTDLDATFEYSDIRGVNFASNNNTTISVFPNPTIDRINVDLSAINLDAGSVDLSLLDNTGRQVYNKTVKGTGIELIDVSNLHPSTYYVVLTQAGEMIHQTTVIKAN